MNVLSLFDGISACHLALSRAGHSVSTYYTAEIDKFASKISHEHYPEQVALGDVTKWREWDIDWADIDLVTGGFPCQAWSVAGKQLGDKDPRGALFWTMLDIMQAVLDSNPNALFLMENVRMKKEFEDYITHHTEQALGTVHKHLINSALVSAQNRQRFYWTNIPGIEQPEDRSLILADVLEEGVGATVSKQGSEVADIGRDKSHALLARDYKGFGNQAMTGVVEFVDRDKAYAIDAHYHKGGNPKQYFEKRRRQLVFHKVIPRGNNKGGVKPVVKSPTITSRSWEHNHTFAVKGAALRGRYKVDGVRQDHKGSVAGKTTQHLEVRQDDKTNALTSVTKDTLVAYEDLTYRKLTPTECERLQTFPDGWTEGVSNTQRYKALGNAWTVDVIAHIFSHIKENAQ